jgi:hypothetical protein
MILVETLNVFDIYCRRRAFYIINEHSGHVLELHAGLTALGTHLEQGRRRADKAMFQLWHIDPLTGLIHSMVDDLVLECKGTQYFSPWSMTSFWNAKVRNISLSEITAIFVQRFVKVLMFLLTFRKLTLLE